MSAHAYLSICLLFHCGRRGRLQFRSSHTCTQTIAGHSDLQGFVRADQTFAIRVSARVRVSVVV